MKKTIFLLATLTTLNCTLMNRTSSEAVSSQAGFIEGNAFGIRKKPITNREYILYICWNLSTYGLRYTQRVIDQFPPNCLDKEIAGYEDLESSLSNSKGLLRNYIFNPRYLDYPLTGISREQLAELQKWMSDRYNENMLIKLGHLNFNPNQMNQDCFVLEAYLLGKYVGSSRSGKKLNWSDGVFKSAFRPPFNEEIKEAREEFKLNFQFKEYPFTSKDFLYTWDRYYISINENKASLTLNLSRSIVVDQLGSLTSVEKQITGIEGIAILLQERNLYNDCTYLNMLEALDKDQFGRMQFGIVGENAEGHAIVVSDKNRVSQNSTVDRMYWIAYSTIVPERYWP